MGEAATATALVTAAGLDLAASSVVADPPRIAVHDTSTATVHLLDTTGAPLPGRTVTVDVDDPAVASVGTVADHGDGRYTAELTGLAPGSVVLSFAVDGSAAPGSATVQVGPLTDPGGDPDPGPGPGVTPDPGGDPGTGGTGGTAGDPGSGDGGLAVTGAGILGAMVAALLVIAAGTVLVHRRRAAS